MNTKGETHEHAWDIAKTHGNFCACGAPQVLKVSVKDESKTADKFGKF